MTVAARLAAALRRPAVALPILITLAALARFRDIAAKPLWFDEAFSVWFSDRSFAYLWSEAPRYEMHTPFYYALLRAWRMVVGSDEAALRAPSALAGVATVVFVYVAARAFGGSVRGPWLALAAGALTALWRLQIEFSQDARHYAFVALAAAMMTAGALRLMADPDAARTPLAQLLRQAPAAAWSYTMVGLGMALALWAHNVAVFSVLTVGAGLGAWWAATGADRGRFVNLAVTAGAAALVYAPNIPIILMQLSVTAGRGFWLPAPTMDQLALLAQHLYGPPLIEAIGLKWALVVTLAWLAAGVLGVARIAWARGKPGLWMGGFVLAMASAPFIMAAAVTYAAQPVMAPRTLLFVQPPLMIALAAAPWLLGAARARAAVAAAVTAVALVTANMSSGVFADIRPYPEALRAFRFFDPSIPVIVAPGDLYVPLSYYAQASTVAQRVLLFPWAPPDFRPAAARNVVVVRGPSEVIAAVADASRVFLAHRHLALAGVDPEGRLVAALRAAGYCAEDVISGPPVDFELTLYDRAGCGL